MIKTLFKSTSGIILAVLLLGACAKKTPAPANTDPTPALSASINGSTWTAQTIDGTLSSGVAMVGGSVSSTGTTISLVMNATAPGTYTVGNANNSIGYTKNGGIHYVINTGSIVVTSYSNNFIIGTFQGSGPNSINSADVATITKGTFTAKLK